MAYISCCYFEVINILDKLVVDQITPLVNGKVDQIRRGPTVDTQIVDIAN